VRLPGVGRHRHAGGVSMTTGERMSQLMEVADGSVTTPQGFVADGLFAGIKDPAPDKLDLGILLSESPCTSAAVFTQNRLAAPPVRLCQRLLESSQPRGVIVNSGVANACTGEQGAAN